MAIYEFAADCIREIPPTSYGLAGLRERADLQRLLRTRVDVVSPETLIIAEEFGEWEDSKRRIDLLGIDQEANLVVIELKRTEDGGHMDLQAIRYASMVSTMTFEKAVEVYGSFLQRHSSSLDARASLLEFLQWDEPDEDRFAQDVRIVLVSAEFSKELTTAVLWLNERDLDIRCVRMKPYSDGDRVLVDVQQVVPLPEVADYQVQIREKEKRERSDRAERYSVRRRFWARLLEYARSRTDLHANISPSEYSWLGTGAGVSGFGYNYVVTQHDAAAELYVDRGHGRAIENKAIFDQFLSMKDSIEASFGGPLEWERLDDKRGCRIRKTIETGGYRSSEESWALTHAAMVDAMVGIEKSVGPLIPRMRSLLTADPVEE